MQLFGNLKPKYDYYSSIDNLPIKLWIEIHKTGDITLLAKKNKSKYKLLFLYEAWKNINDEYLDAFGLSEELEYSLQQKRMAAIEKANYIITGMTHHLTHAEIHEQNSNFSKSNKDAVDVYTNLARLTKIYNVRLQAQKVTVREYYTFIKEANNGGKSS